MHKYHAYLCGFLCSKQWNPYKRAFWKSLTKSELKWVFEKENFSLYTHFDQFSIEIPQNSTEF